MERGLSLKDRPKTASTRRICDGEGRLHVLDKHEFFNVKGAPQERRAREGQTKLRTFVDIVVQLDGFSSELVEVGGVFDFRDIEGNALAVRGNGVFLVFHCKQKW